MKRAGLLLVGLGLGCATRCGAQDAAELELDHRIESAFVTPHTAWAKPYALGRTRVLFFTWGRGLEPREVVELNQRFDLDSKMAFWARVVDSDREHWHGDEVGRGRIDRLLDETWDAFVFLNVSVDRLPAEQQVRLLQAVLNGSGLVLVGVNDPRILKPKNRLARSSPTPTLCKVWELPWRGGGAAGEGFTIRKGRGVRLSGRPDIPYRPGWEVEYDLWSQRLGSAILWAAGREPQVQLTLECATGGIARASLPGAAVRVAWQAPDTVPGMTLQATLRRSDGWTTALRGIEAKAGADNASLEIPAVRTGEYHVDVIARSPRGIEAFRTVSFAVVDERRVEAVVLDRDWGEVGERLAGSVTLTGTPAADERLTVSLLDRRGRELARRQIDPAAAGGRFDFPIEPWMPMLVTVRATLTRSDCEIAGAWAFARVTRRHRDLFNFVMWDYPSGTLGPYGEEALAQNNVTVHLSSGMRPPDFAAAFDMAWIPYSTRIMAEKDAKGVMKPCCWNDESRIQAHVDRIVSNCLPARSHGVFAYSLGDEGAVRGSCTGPHCLAAYQEYLHGEYGTIAALNASWGSAYAGFGDVRLLKEDDAAEKEALRIANFPRWYDRQAYQSHNFCKLCERFGAAFRRIDPASLCGFEGSGTFKDGDDLDGFVRANTFWSPYPGPADEVVRSIAPRDFPRANWMGYTKDADTLLEKYWRMVTRGSDSVWWWRWDCIGRFHGWLAPNLDPYPAVKEIIADTRIVRDGLGRLLKQADMQDDAVGMLYSQPSAYAAGIQSSPSFGTYQAEHTAWHQALRGLGLNFRYVTDAMLRRGEAGLDRFKVMVLPMAQAMSAAEAQQLRDWVDAGGTLIADVRPAIYDGHLKALASGALDDVFGIRRIGLTNAVVRNASLTGTVAGVGVAMNLVRVKTDGGVVATTAQSLGGPDAPPLFAIHAFGKGRAVLLNLALSSYPSLAVATIPEAAADPLRALLLLGGVRPALTVTGADARRLLNAETFRWRDGDVEIVSVFRPAGTAEGARIGLPESRFVYDLKAGRSLGRLESIDLTITPSRAQFYVLSPRELDAARVTVDRSTVARGGLVRATLRYPRAASRRAARVELVQPDGRVAAWLNPVVVVDSGKNATVHVPVAFNDPPGTWTLRAVDLYGGMEASCRFRVKE